MLRLAQLFGVAFDRSQLMVEIRQGFGSRRCGRDRDDSPALLVQPTDAELSSDSLLYFSIVIEG
jgi:hypothetical protein